MEGLAVQLDKAVMSALSEAISLLYRRGLVQLRGGNVSVAEGDLIYITPSSLPRHRISWRDIAVIRPDGSVVRGRPSSEWRMHVAIYKTLGGEEGVRAVVHAHPKALLAASSAGIRLDATRLMEAEAGVRCVARVGRAKPGTWELAEAVASTLKSTGCKAAVLEDHGAVTVAHDLWAALDSMEALEDLAWMHLATYRCR